MGRRSGKREYYVVSGFYELPRTRPISGTGREPIDMETGLLGTKETQGTKIRGGTVPRTYTRSMS